MYNVVQEVSELTAIPEEVLVSLLNKVKLCIYDAIVDSIDDKQTDCIELDVGIGQLNISIVDNQIKYKFIPSKDFESEVRKTVIDEDSPLKYFCEKSLVKKILHTYKELL